MGVSSEDLQPSVLDKHTLMRGNAEIFTPVAFLENKTHFQDDCSVKKHGC